MTEVCFVIDLDGSQQALYDDVLPLDDLGEALGGYEIRRASHVEPAPEGKWDADMTPVGGPASLGPFNSRAAALAAEVRWLRENRL